MPQPITVLIADDHALVREGIRQVFSGQTDIVVAGEASTGEDALAQAAALHPTVLILDVSMPHGSGLEILPQVRRTVPDTRILMLSVHDHPEYVLEAVRSGAHGYLRKDTLPAALRDAVRRLAAGETCFDLPAGDAPETAAPTVPDAQNRLALLTRRERDVFLGVVSGETNRDIAQRLTLSIRTVESYRESLMRKLGLRSVAELTRLALLAGLTRDPG